MAVSVYLTFTIFITFLSHYYVPVSCLDSTHLEETLLEVVNSEVRHMSVQEEDQNPTGCQCRKLNCGCCLHMDIPKIHLDDIGCVNVTYLKKDIGFSLLFSLDGKIIINQTVSARNPPPLCVGVPHFTKELSACIEFYDMSYSKQQITGCIKVGFRLIHVISEDFKLGCFRIPLPGKMSEHEKWMVAQSLEKIIAGQLHKRKSYPFL